jgi:polyhydroxybutyrate depolymerase
VPDRIDTSTSMQCRIWSSCNSGRELQLCLHPGDHMMQGAWLEDGLRWARSVSGVPELGNPP